MDEDRSAPLVLLLRLYVGFAVFIPLGVQKLAGYPESAAAMVEGFGGTALGSGPAIPFLIVFAYALPFIETLGGLALVVGWRTRRVFLVLAALFVLLGFGTTLQGRIPSTADNLVFMAACLFGYALSGSDRYGLTGRSERSS